MNKIDKLMLMKYETIIDFEKNENKNCNELKLKLLRDVTTKYMKIVNQLQNFS